MGKALSAAPRRGYRKITDIQLEDLNNLLGIIEFRETFARRQEAESETGTHLEGRRAARRTSEERLDGLPYYHSLIITLL